MEDAGDAFYIVAYGQLDIDAHGLDCSFRTSALSPVGPPKPPNLEQLRRRQQHLIGEGARLVEP
jgi:hypothetical protein